MFVVVHVLPTGQSRLPLILSRAGRLLARHAHHGDRIERGRILVAPPDRHLLLEATGVRIDHGRFQVPTAGEPRLLTRTWLRACDAYLSATLAHTRYLRTSGRLTDTESLYDVRMLEEEHRQVRELLDRLQAEMELADSCLRLPQDPARRLSMAAQRELRRYRDEVCEDSRQLRARSAALLNRSRDVRRLRLEGRAGTGSPGTMAGRPGTR